MHNIDMKGSKIIVKDEKRKLYLRSVPLYRGMTRWNSYKDQAMKFNDMTEAVAAVDSVGDKDLDIVYEVVSEEEDQDKEDEGIKKFVVEVLMDGACSIVNWSGKDSLVIFDRAVLMAKALKLNLLSVIIEEKESIVP